MSTAVISNGEAGGGMNAIKQTYTPKELYTTKCVKLNAAPDTRAKIEEIRSYFHKTWEVYEQVFRSINSDEGFYIKPIHKLRHPLMFYFGHTATFYMNKLVLAGLTTRINPKFEETFAIGVDEMSWDDLNEAHYDWPTVEEVWHYRSLVRQRIDELIDSNKFKFIAPLTFADSQKSDSNAFFWALNMGIEHERIHLETASVHLRELPLHLVTKAGGFWDPCPIAGEPPSKNEMVAFRGGNVRVGRDMQGPLYGWDQDYASDDYSIDVAPFSASERLISNKEFYEFVKAGGYTEQKWWDEEGWNWVSWKKPTHPWFWVPRGNDFLLRVQVEEIPMPWDWPAEVNNLEAKAYCNWLSSKSGKKLRLPTEAEWMHMRDVCLGNLDQPDWEKAPGNLNMEHYRSSCPVTMFKQGALYDVVGNVWQHTETPIYPLPGFRVHPLYDDFSMPTFDGRHFCMKGGTWISTGNAATRDARFAFRRHFFQYIGIRVVEGSDINEAAYLRNVLGLDPEIDVNADFAFGKPLDNQPNFGQRLAARVADIFEKNKGPGVGRDLALDLFCGAGRTTFELTKTFTNVIGSDFSARRLQTAFAIRERGFAQYSIVNELGEREGRTVDASNYDWGTRRENAFFYQADPSNLHAHMDKFDCIVGCNVLENTYKPSGVPAHLVSRLKKGGVLVLAYHCNWNKDIVKADYSFAKAAGDAERRTAAQVIRLLLKDVAEEIVLGEPANLTAVIPQTSRTGFFADFELIAFRKL